MFSRIATKLIFVFVLSSAPAAFAEPGTATLPLEELLKLQRAGRGDENKPPAPTAFGISSFDVDARIIGNAIEATATITLSVFEKGWVRVPLLLPDDGLDITALPKLENAHFVVQDGALFLMTQDAGMYDFDIGLLKRASRTNGIWQVSLKPAEAAIRRMRILHDHSLFEVRSKDLRRDGEALTVFAKDGVLSFSWKNLKAEPQARLSHAQSPPIEAVVLWGKASVVMTLDGQRIARLLYHLRLPGKKTIELSIPKGQELKKVYVNGLSKTFILKDTLLALDVAPARQGERSATVEIVLREQREAMSLGGHLDFSLPTVSWDVHALECTLFLPQVFNYHWRSGSLSPMTASNNAHYTFELPTPGKSISVGQQLVLGEANLSVAYAVDLEDNYFR